jgi:hypothetical protein
MSSPLFSANSIFDIIIAEIQKKVNTHGKKSRPAKAGGAVYASHSFYIILKFEFAAQTQCRGSGGHQARQGQNHG